MSPDIFRLDGKVAVVTGGGRGVGKMIAAGLLGAGAKVYLASRKTGDLDAAVAELSPAGEVCGITADLGTPDGVAILTKHLADRESGVDALFNNAGANWGSSFEQFPASGWDKVLDVNVKGVFLLTQALLPMLKSASSREDPSRVINTGSVDGIVAPGVGMNNFSYSASKAAVHMMTKQLAGEFAPDVLVNAIAPGLFPSKMTAAILDAGADEIARRIPLQRIGRPADIAGLAVFLASEASSYITGAVIPIDGGLIATR